MNKKSLIENLLKVLIPKDGYKFKVRTENTEFRHVYYIKIIVDTFRYFTDKSYSVNNPDDSIELDIKRYLAVNLTDMDVEFVYTDRERAKKIAIDALEHIFDKLSEYDTFNVKNFESFIDDYDIEISFVGESTIPECYYEISSGLYFCQLCKDLGISAYEITDMLRSYLSEVIGNEVDVLDSLCEF